ncbi:MAG: FmdB family zinc ribbon protein [Thermoanaerobaculia bacterium]
MPVYDFKCKDCGEKFEFLTFSINEKAYCIKCKSENLEKLPSRFGFSSGGSFVSSSSAGDSCSCCSSSNCSSCKSK